MPFSRITDDKIMFSVVDDVVDSKGKIYFLEIKFSKSFFNNFFNDNNENFLIDFDNKNAITRREIQVLRYLAQGNNNYEIAEKLNVSVHTAKAHVQNIFKKLCVKDRTEAVVTAIKNHLIDI